MSSNVVISIFLVLCLCAVVYGYSDCGSNVGTIVSVSISGCAANAARCTLKRRTNATMELTFTPSEDSEVLKADVHGVILGVPWPFELPNSDGCVDSGITCPIKAGQTYKYVTTLPIKSEYPRVTVDIKWELKNKDDKDIICAMIPSKIG